MTLPASRPLYLLAFIVCVLLMAAALYLEHGVGLEPCPLCILQRIAVMVIGVICLAAVLHNPEPRNGKRTGARRLWRADHCGQPAWRRHRRAPGLAAAPAAGSGAIVHLPLDYMLETLPLWDVLSQVLSGTAQCAEVTWTFLGLSIAEGTLIAFICFTLFGVMQLVRKVD
ncbi:disulfide bond formation protein B [Halopseudomonas pachastrellae]|nr:disulfide bond formation protein B [Halopseudomonas pachastrellae]